MRNDVARLVAEGDTDKVIAGKLGMSHKTVEYHVARLIKEWNLDPGKNIRVQITRKILLAA